MAHSRGPLTHSSLAPPHATISPRLPRTISAPRGSLDIFIGTEEIFLIKATFSINPGIPFSMSKLDLLLLPICVMAGSDIV